MSLPIRLLLDSTYWRFGTFSILLMPAYACAPDTKVTESPSEALAIDANAVPALPAFSSFPSRDTRECIFEAANIVAFISDYDELDRDFLVTYASKLTFEEFSSTSKDSKSYADDLDAVAIERLLNEAKTNRDCRSS